MKPVYREIREGDKVYKCYDVDTCKIQEKYFGYYDHFVEVGSFKGEQLKLYISLENLKNDMVVILKESPLLCRLMDKFKGYKKQDGDEVFPYGADIYIKDKDGV